MNQKINFIFIRHGESCQNLVGSMYSKYDPRYNELLDKFSDPTLSDTGTKDSIKAGLLLKKNLTKYNINKIDFIAASTMIRAIETAYFMTFYSDYQKKTIINVCPYLRETRTPDSATQTNKSFPLKTLAEQKDYFKSKKMSDSINFNNVLGKDPSGKFYIRETPGDIKRFIKWFNKNIFILHMMPHIKKISDNNPINVLVFLHSGVMKDFSTKGPRNNTGFILQTTYNNNKKEIEYFKKNVYMHHTDFEFNRTKTSCPSINCPGIC
jgi:phosphohistidine phosphatase SixA